MNSHSSTAFHKAAAERILILDGASGSELQQAITTEDDLRGDRFADHPSSLAGNLDLLTLTQPHVVSDLHRRYLAAGADIITTNTFSSTTVAQREYGLDQAALIHEMNKAAAQLARAEADSAAAADGRPRFRGWRCRPNERHPVAVAASRRSGLPSAQLRGTGPGILRADRRARGRRSRRPPNRNNLRHAQCKGRHHGGSTPGTCQRDRGPDHDLGHHHRPLRSNPVWPNRCSLLAVGASRRPAHHWPQLRSWRGPRCGPSSASWLN